MKKLKAGSLQLVTFIMVVIALFLSAFIVLIHVHKKFRIKTNHIIETVALTDKGINHLLNNESIGNDTISIPLYDEDYKSIKAHSSFWGIYEKGYSEASIKNNTLKKTVLIGSKLGDHDDVALFVKDNKSPLVLVGNTKIKGNAYLPKRGVKSGNIAGTSYYGEQFIYGTKHISKSFPKLNHKLLSHIKAIDKNTFNYNEIDYIDLSASKIHVNSFEKPPQLAYSNSEIILSDISLTGHIKIESQTKIVVDASAKLTDVILIAPVIEIRQHVKGTFQAFATERINVAKHVTLDYPSSLVLSRDYLKEELDSTLNMIFVDDYSVVKGNILALEENWSGNYDAQIKINPNATIKGNIYCEQNLELRGTVYGTVFTNNFIIKEAGSIYQNHLYNALIDITELEPEFVSFPMQQSKKGIAKWLY